MIETGQQVDVYWNLHEDVFSIRGKHHTAPRLRVLGHSADVIMKDVTWVVQLSGNERVRRERRKNVHAWARGIILSWAPKGSFIADDTNILPRNAYWRHVTYNPYKHQSFQVCVVQENGIPQEYEPIYFSNYVRMRRVIRNEEYKPHIMSATEYMDSEWRIRRINDDAYVGDIH